MIVPFHYSTANYFIIKIKEFSTGTIIVVLEKPG
jgi:hypothetical protein